MMTPLKIRLLASTNNARGDLFTRLTADLFFALGYSDLQFDVQKSGREIDIQGTHRLEPRRMVAECKAQAKKMGGSELNKFFGVVSRERSKEKTTPVIGYFVSLGGFRETGIEQEQDTGEQERSILLDGQQVVEELIRISILVDQADAAEQAGRCVEHQGLKDVVVDGMELLGHELGYIWAIYYSKGKQRTHVALVHADGTPLASAVAKGIITADRKCRGSLHKLTYLSPPATSKEQKALAKKTLERYRQWIVTEFGAIQLDGLPADADLSAFTMRLERLYVPLKVISSKDEQNNSTFSAGEFFRQHSRFSLLAKPGGGKSTFLKRIAVAYAEPERLAESDDGLPEQNWLPLILRCRELRDRAHRPIRELLNDLPQHAAMRSEQTTMFQSLIDEALQTGQALLLVDGLDEISDKGARTTFAGHLRTFLAMFPKVGLVVTSREAGYRQVAGVIASTCEQVSLAPFDESAVQQLCENWHVEVVGDNKSIRTEAKELAGAIWKNERIRALAENPLMLTTLLVVRRCIGELPTRRVALYREAVRVLIYTWNTEGFAPMDLEEALAQLSYVACVMMNEGVQQIGRKRLLKLLQEARDEMQEELQFTSISPAEFIERIEYRSSLLMQTGHEEIDDEFQPVYEFRHLTFQEYLAARGLVEEQYPGRNEGPSLVDLLEPHFKEERWREVIPLAAVIAGRKAEPLVKRLTSVALLDSSKNENSDAKNSAVFPLRQCLLDEVLITPSSLNAAILGAARYKDAELFLGITGDTELRNYVVGQLRGKFATVFEKTVSSAYFQMETNWDDYPLPMSFIASGCSFQNPSDQFDANIGKKIGEWLHSGDRIKQALSAFHLARISFRSGRVGDRENSKLNKTAKSFRDTLGNLLSPDDPQLALAAAWALAWMGGHRLTKIPPEPEVIQALFKLWREADSGELRRIAAWAFSAQPLLKRDTFAPGVWGDYLHLHANWDTKDNPESQHEFSAAHLVLAWYVPSIWDDSELAEKLSQRPKHRRGYPLELEMLADLGADGQRVLDDWNAKSKKKKAGSK